MLEITHAIVGAAIGIRAGGPAAAFLLGWLSHHVLDMIPHFDRGSFFIKSLRPRYLGGKREHLPEGHLTGKEWGLIVPDLGLTAGIFVWPFLVNPFPGFWLALIAAAGAVLPDVIGAAIFWFPKLRKVYVFSAYDRFHSFFHWTLPESKWWLGVGTQLAVILIAILA
jgi:hypothetical protein